MKVVLDANVLLAGLGTHGLCQAVVELVLVAHTPVTSEPLISETLGHLDKKFKLSFDRIGEIERFLRTQFEIVAPADVPADACRDPNDLMVLGTAIAADAGCIVTGDKDLLSLGKYQVVLILSPRAFYEAQK